jgi:hypothetical protein
MTEAEVNQDNEDRWYSAWKVVMDQEAKAERTRIQKRREEIAKITTPLSNTEKKVAAKKVAKSMAQKKMDRWVKRGVQPRIDHIFFHG